MTARRSPHRDCRDGSELPWDYPRDVPEPRRTMERLRADYWRMTASFRETW